MTCDDVRALLNDALDGGDAAADQEAAAATHLESCADCARVARELSSIHRLSLELRTAEPAAAAKSDTKKRKGSRRRRAPQPPRRFPWALPGAIAAAILIAFIFYFSRPDPQPEPPFKKPLVVAPLPLGTLESASGRVLRLSKSAETPLAAKAELFESEGLKVSGRAVFVWRDGTRMELEGETLLDRLEERKDGKLVTFVRGAIVADVTPQTDGALRFATPHGEARVLGTVLRLKVNPDAAKGTRLEVERGKVELSNKAGKSVQVEAGQYAVAATGRELVAKKIEPPGWKNVTNGVGGAVWGKAGVTILATVPGRDELIAGVTDAWLWSTTDGGATWRPLGDAGQGPIQNHPTQILFDPKDAGTFWVCGIYGPGIFRTTDGGKSFRRLGKLDHMDGLAVDFSDPFRRTLLATMHLDGAGLQLSRDGGETWERIGERLPKESNSSCGPYILDSQTFLVDGLGSLDKTEGIYRSADGGKTWTRVSKVQTAGSPMLSSKGVLYWQANAGFASGILKSVDRGLTWSTMKGPVKALPVELPDGTLAGVFESQVYVTSNGGESWEKLGAPAPIKPARTIRGMGYEQAVYSPERRAFYVSRSSEGRIADAIFRGDFPE